MGGYYVVSEIRTLTFIEQNVEISHMCVFIKFFYIHQYLYFLT